MYYLIGLKVNITSFYSKVFSRKAKNYLKIYFNSNCMKIIYHLYLDLQIQKYYIARSQLFDRIRIFHQLRDFTQNNNVVFNYETNCKVANDYLKQDSLKDKSFQFKVLLPIRRRSTFKVFYYLRIIPRYMLGSCIKHVAEKLKEIFS